MTFLDVLVELFGILEAFPLDLALAVSAGVLLLVLGAMLDHLVAGEVLPRKELVTGIALFLSTIFNVCLDMVIE